MNKEINLPKLKQTITLFTTLYAFLFIGSLICIVLHTSSALFSALLGAAVLVRLCVVNPKRSKYTEAKAQLDRKERMEDMQAAVQLAQQNETK